MSEDYETQERIAIMVESGIPEAQAKKLAQKPECVTRFEKLREKVEADKLAKRKEIRK
jgi:hypothetical protein